MITSSGFAQVSYITNSPNIDVEGLTWIAHSFKQVLHIKFYMKN